MDFILKLRRDVGFEVCEDPHPEDGKHPDFERQAWDYWIEQDYTMGMVKGLFKHYPEYGF